MCDAVGHNHKSQSLKDNHERQVLVAEVWYVTWLGPNLISQCTDWNFQNKSVKENFKYSEMQTDMLAQMWCGSKMKSKGFQVQTY